MDLIATFLLGMWVVACWMVFIYPLFPKLYFVTVNQLPLKRLTIFGYSIVLNMVILILGIIFIPKDQPSANDGAVLMVPFFLGMVVALALVILGGFKKYNQTKIIPANISPKEIKTENQPSFADKILDNANHLKDKIGTHTDSFVKKIDELDQKNKLEFAKAKTDLKEQISKISAELKEGWTQVKNDIEKPKKIKPIIQDTPRRSFYRYELDYTDRFGNETTREIDIISIHKSDGNNRWYFNADTKHGERTFKSQRVIRLKDQWTNSIYDTSQEIRKHILSEYPVVEKDDDDF